MRNRLLYFANGCDLTLETISSCNTSLATRKVRFGGASLHSQRAGKMLQHAVFGFHEHGFKVNAKVWLIT
jgi:hypothetical protein